MKNRTTMIRRAARHAGFTDRELDVLTLLTEGATGAEAASRLGIEPNTARGYLHSARQRVGAKTNEELITILALGET